MKTYKHTKHVYIYIIYMQYAYVYIIHTQRNFFTVYLSNIAVETCVDSGSLSLKIIPYQINNNNI